MTRDIKHIVLALAMAATAGAVSPPTLRGVKDAETVGDTFEMSLAMVSRDQGVQVPELVRHAGAGR